MKRCTAVLAILMLLVLAGCGGEKAMPPPDKGTDVQPRDVPAPPQPTPESVPSGAADQVTVYFATDRAEFVPTPWSYAGEFFWALGVFLAGLLLLRSLARMTKDEFRGRVRALWILWGIGVALLVANGVYECVDIQQDLERQGRLFGGERFITPFATGGEPELEDVLQFGSCTVTIPPDRVIGEVSRPSFWKADWFEDPAEHNVALDVERKRADAFFAEVKAIVAGSTDQDAFVFVHGYNVSFEDAVIRTGQIAYDLDFQGAAIAYSWPSQGQKGKYTVDEANVGWTVEHLHRFLLMLEREIGAKKIHLIAHSMGSRALGAALLRIALERHGESPLFHEVIFAAPDIDRDTFQQHIAPNIVPASEGLTLYASSRDDALGISGMVHGSARAGVTSDGVVIVEGMDTIDVSKVTGSHSYIGDSQPVLSDLKALLRFERTLTEKAGVVIGRLDDHEYWILEELPVEKK